MLLLAAVIDFGRAYDAYIVLTNAAREGARSGTIKPYNVAQVEQVVVDDVLGSGTNITHMSDFGADNVSVSMGTTAVTVTVTYDFPLWFGGLVGIQEFTLTKLSAMPLFLED